MPGAVIAIVAHEFAKAVTAYRLGDGAVKAAGRLTLNPLKHIDPLGFIFMALFSYGWANPVKITPFAYKEKRKAMVAIFAVPFLINIILGITFALAFRIWSIEMGITSQQNANIAAMLHSAARLNISFALFNLIPVHPLTGIWLLSGISPHAALKVAQQEKFLQFILAILIIFGFVSQVFGPLTRNVLHAII